MGLESLVILLEEYELVVIKLQLRHLSNKNKLNNDINSIVLKSMANNWQPFK